MKSQGLGKCFSYLIFSALFSHYSQFQWNNWKPEKLHPEYSHIYTTPALLRSWFTHPVLSLSVFQLCCLEPSLFPKSTQQYLTTPTAFPQPLTAWQRLSSVSSVCEACSCHDFHHWFFLLKRIGSVLHVVCCLLTAEVCSRFSMLIWSSVTKLQKSHFSNLDS